MTKHQQQFYSTLFNIYKYKTIEANANTGEIQLPGNPLAMRLKNFQVGADGFPGSWNFTGICISLYSFVPMDIYSAK